MRETRVTVAREAGMKLATGLFARRSSSTGPTQTPAR